MKRNRNYDIAFLDVLVIKFCKLFYIHIRVAEYTRKLGLVPMYSFQVTNHFMSLCPNSNSVNSNSVCHYILIQIT